MEVYLSSPFGTETRTRLLVALRLLDESYPRELSRLLGVSLSAVQKALAGLERDGLAAVRTVGRTRVARIDPRYFARRELLAFLGRLAEADTALAAAATTLRRRPRRTGKPR